MDESFQHLWERLIEKRLIVGQPERLGGGNMDRAESGARSSWKAQAPDGSAIKLTMGKDLSNYRDRSVALHGVAGAITPAIIFFETIGLMNVVGETFVDGQPLETLLASGKSSSEELGLAVAKTIEPFRSLSTPSTNEARQSEWNAWTDSLLELSCWGTAGGIFLRDVLLPPLRVRAEAGPSRLTWVHGDLTGRNILVDSNNRGWLIDAEFATQTHFPAADAARFHALTPGADRLGSSLSEALPQPDLTARLLFWLQQVQREAASNRPDYLERWLPNRLGTIRQLAEELLGRALPECPWSLPPALSQGPLNEKVAYHLEEARWLIDSPSDALRLAGWCHVTKGNEVVNAVEAFDGATRVGVVATSPRPDVRAHFGGNPNALDSGFVLLLPPVSPEAKLTLSAVLSTGEKVPFWSALAGNLPGRGPVLCGYSAWAEMLDPDLPPIGFVADPTITFSILVPVYNTATEHLRACLKSVRRQHYGKWELRLVNDASSEPDIATILAEQAKLDERIFVQTRTNNGGIARATNDALAAATGDFVVLLDHDDVLRPHALGELAAKLQADPGLDAVYSDEDKLDATGRRVVPLFKPNYSPEFLRGVMYIGHVLCVRTTAARAAGGFDPAFDGIQDYEFLLRVSERTQRIGHVPKILYHWRQSPGSSALSGNVKGDMDRKQVRAVQAHLERLGQARTAEAMGGHRVKLSARVLEQGKGSMEEQEKSRLETKRVAVAVWAEGEDPLAILRRTVENTEAQIVLLVSDQVSGLDEPARNELVALARLADSGCVSPVLVAPNSQVLESGCVLVEGLLAPIMTGFDLSGDGFSGSLRCNRDVSAVSPWCVAVRGELVKICGEKVGTWADFCASIHNAGKFNRVCASVRVTLPFPWQDYAAVFRSCITADESLQEAGSREPGEAQSNRRTEMGDRAQNSAISFQPSALNPSPSAPASLVSTDPFYNPHFATEPADYRLARQPPHLPPRQPAFLGHIESVVPEQLSDGFLVVRGWCFHLRGKAVRIQLTAGSVQAEAVAAEPRMDVRRIYPVFTDGNCGFVLRVRVPSGHHRVRVQATAESAEGFCLLDQPVRVPPGMLLRRWRQGDPSSLLASQMLAGPSHAPRSLRGERFPRSAAGAKSIPRLSIVTPSYRHRRFLEETLRSVVNQPVPVDYVVQDGGSTDGSVEVLRRYSSKLTAWTSESDRGQADAITRGFARTTGRPDDLMAWINSDDFYLPGALGYVTAFFAAHPDVDVMYGHRIVVDEQSREVGRWFLPRHDDAVLRLNDFVPQETMFWRRRIWDRVVGVDARFKFAMDWDLLLRFQSAGANMVRVPYFLAGFRVHSAQKTAAQISSVGQSEIDALRRRTFGRPLSSEEVEHDSRLAHFLRESARIEFLWRTFGIRAK